MEAEDVLPAERVSLNQDMVSLLFSSLSLKISFTSSLSLSHDCISGGLLFFILSVYPLPSFSYLVRMLFSLVSSSSLFIFSLSLYVFLPYLFIIPLHCLSECVLLPFLFILSTSWFVLLPSLFIPSQIVCYFSFFFSFPLRLYGLLSCLFTLSHHSLSGGLFFVFSSFYLSSFSLR